MKRKPQVKRALVKRFRPWLFWWPCLVCRQEFRRELGWRKRRWLSPDLFVWEVVCVECCPTEPEAYRAITGAVP